jgi:hypothetical protein
MGYNIGTFCDFFDLVDRGAMPRAGRIFDCGSQDAVIASEHVGLFLERAGRAFPGRTARAAFAPPATVFPARAVFEWLGYEYICSDVDGRPGSVYLDFHDSIIDLRSLGAFDLVCNHGTTEHILDPISAFATIHALTRQGGLMWHAVPAYGLGNHGFINLTPKFWAALISVNRYEPMSAKMTPVERSPALDGNMYTPGHEFITGAYEAAQGASVMSTMILRKTSDAIFFPPLDFYDWQSPTTARMVWASTQRARQLGMWPFPKIVTDVNQHLANAGATFRLAADATNGAVDIVSVSEPHGILRDHGGDASVGLLRRLAGLMSR